MPVIMTPEELLEAIQCLPEDEAADYQAQLAAEQAAREAA